jgi:superfamily II RNA helicase
MDNIGFALVVPGKFMDVRLIASLMDASPAAIQSQIGINFSMVLNLLLSHRPAEVQRLLGQSFADYIRKETNDGRNANNSDHLWEQFLRHFRFLKTHGYIDDEDRLTADGLWASQLRVDQPLLIAEGFRHNVFPTENPALLAAMVAAFVNEREYDDAGDRTAFAPGIESAFGRLAKALQPLVEEMRQQNFGARSLYLMPAVGMHAWADARPWEWVRRLTGLEEGDLAMLIMRTADNLRHIAALKATFPGVAACAAEAVKLILRDPVVSDYF